MLIWPAALTFGLLAVAGTPPPPAPPLLPPGLTEHEPEYKQWVNGLYEMGVTTKGDSVHFTEEARRVATDSLVRRIVYPETYTWEVEAALLKAMRLKVAFWYLINLYESDPPHRDLVLRSVFAYDNLLDMERALVSTFYTFGLLDPRVCVMHGGRPEIAHPDLAERRLKVVEELVSKIKENRKQNPKKPIEPMDGVPSGGKR